jgi:ABC-type sugar transport system permease subunit
MATRSKSEIREYYGLGEKTLLDRMRENKAAYVFITLPMIAFGTLFYYPIVQGIWMTLHRARLGAGDTWVGLGNYIWLFTNDLFVYALGWTAVFVASTTFLQIVFGMLLALLVNELTKGYREWTTAVIMSPYFCAPLVGGIIWMWFVNPSYGVMGRAMGAVGMDAIYFLSEWLWPNIVMIIAQTWHDYAYAGIIYAATLKSIPSSHYEAAAIDGASRLQRFRDVTLPHLMIPTVIILAIRTAWNMAEFAQPFALTAGGPGTQTYLLSILVFDLAFIDIRFGRAYTVGIVMLAISVSMALIYIKLIDQEDQMYL